MATFEKNIEIRWSDLDPNFHVLHSKYYDFGAYCRMAFMVENGFTPAVMAKHNIGPILFREECIFRKEIKFGDKVTINFEVEKLTSNFARWTMVHEILINDKTLAAVITADGAWMDTVLRKLAIPSAEVATFFNNAPKSDKFCFNDSR